MKKMEKMTRSVEKIERKIEKNKNEAKKSKWNLFGLRNGLKESMKRTTLGQKKGFFIFFFSYRLSVIPNRSDIQTCINVRERFGILQ